MHRLIIAFRAFFAVLFRRSAAEAVERALGASQPSTAAASAAGSGAVAPSQPSPRSQQSSEPARPSDALALLALLQREARFVDFIQEDLSAYSDAQIGAAARDVQRQSAAVITRAFGVGAIVDGSEGSEQTVPAGFDAARYKLTGNVTGQPPYRGRLRHHGWQASRCVLPAFTGSVEAAQILAPVEIELS